MDNIFEKSAFIREVVSFYWAKAQGLVATKIGKVVLALLVIGAIAFYSHHRGAVGAAKPLNAQIEQLKKQLADAHAQPEIAPPNFEQEHADADLAARLSKTEEAKKTLEQKVADYEKQLAHRPAKGRGAGGFVLSPADARRLSNIK